MLQPVIRLAAGVTLTLTAAAMFALNSNPNPNPSPCFSLDATILTPADVAAHQAAGWSSDPTDGAERLYSPGCPTNPANSATRTR